MPVKDDTLTGIRPPPVVAAGLVDFPVGRSERVFPQHLVRKGARWSSGSPAVSHTQAIPSRSQVDRHRRRGIQIGIRAVETKAWRG